MRYNSDKETFEEYMERFVKNFDKSKQYVIFGTAKKSKNVRKKIANVLCYVDNDEKKWGTMLEGLEIKSPESLKEMPGVKVIVASAQFLSIFEQLKGYGIPEEDYCDFREMLMIADYKLEQRICVSDTYFVTGNRCTLSCKGCIEYIPYLENRKEFPVEEIVASVDDFFRYVDYSETIQFSGGETLLHQQLGEMIKHAYENYVVTGRVEQIHIVTNGTIIPTDEVLQMLKRYNVKVYMSDYRETIGKRCRIDKLIKLFETMGIDYQVESHFGRLDEGKWYDMGSPFVCRNMSRDELKHHFQRCTTSDWTVWNSKFFICNPVRVNMMSFGNEGSIHDYVDLRRDSKAKFLKYYLGYNDKGYFDFCDRCNGRGTSLNEATIRAGEQE